MRYSKKQCIYVLISFDELMPFCGFILADP